MTSVHKPNIRRALCVVLAIFLLLPTAFPAWASGIESIPLRIPITGQVRKPFKTATIDTSNLSQGYVMCRYTGSASKAAVQVERIGSGKIYTHFISCGGDYASIPLTEGSGRYTVSVWEHLAGKRYSLAAQLTVDVSLEDDLLPFLYASHIIRFREGSLAVEKARELAEKAGGEPETIAAVYDFIVKNIRYDNDKAISVEAGYISEPDTVMKTGKGICIDYTALMASMLRSLGIPVKMIYGREPDGAYHSWVMVYSSEGGIAGNQELSAGEWTLFDPTFAANISKESWVPDKDGYEDNYIY